MLHVEGKGTLQDGVLYFNAVCWVVEVVHALCKPKI